MNMQPPKAKAPVRRQRAPRPAKRIKARVIAYLCHPQFPDMDQVVAESKWHEIFVEGYRDNASLKGATVELPIVLEVAGKQFERTFEVPLDRGEMLNLRLDCWDYSTPAHARASELAEAQRRALIDATFKVKLAQALRVEVLRDATQELASANGA